MKKMQRREEREHRGWRAALLFQARSNEPDLCAHRHFCSTGKEKERRIIRRMMSRRTLHRLFSSCLANTLRGTTSSVPRLS